MSSYHRCSKCNSDHMIDGAYIADDHGPRVVVGVERHPDKGHLTRMVSTEVHGCICGSCGFVELYANRPVDLYDAYQHVAQGQAGPSIRA